MQYFQNSYKNADTLYELKKNNYDVNIYTQTYYAYENAKDMEGYGTNISGSLGYSVTSKLSMALGVIRLSAYRYLPIAAKSLTGYMDTGLFNEYLIEDAEYPKFTCNMKTVYNTLNDATFTKQDGRNNFSFIHIDGCHLPNSYNEKWEEAKGDERWDLESAMIQSFAIIDIYIKQMKEMGIYENSTIIITGDHASAVSDTKDVEGVRLTTLLVKQSGESKGDIKINPAQVSQDNLWATIFKSEGIKTEKDYGKSVFEIDPKEERVRYYHFQKTNDGDDEIVTYKISGSGRDFDNWEIDHRHFIGELYK